MTRFVSGVLVAALFGAGAAHAADMRMPVKAAPMPAAVIAQNWSGFYVGGHGGYGWSKFTAADVDGYGNNSLTAKGGFGGAQLGYNFQAGQWVYGVEGDASFGNMNLTSYDPAGSGDYGHGKVDRTVTAAGRIGYAFDRVLVFAKGGAAWSHEKWDFHVFGANITGDVDRFGWVVGGGVEVALAANWSLKAEYNYLDLGAKTLTFNAPANITVSTTQVDLAIQMVKIGLNYRF